jgi:hypothetical protein
MFDTIYLAAKWKRKTKVASCNVIILPVVACVFLFKHCTKIIKLQPHKYILALRSDRFMH